VTSAEFHDAIRQLMLRDDRVAGEHVKLSEQLRKHDEEPMWITRFVKSRPGQFIITAIGTIATDRLFRND
jgi:hypothetical protein